MNQKNVYLLLGSNLGDRLANLNQASDLIRNKIGVIVVASQVYETSPWGKTDQPVFLNQALQVESPRSAPELLFQSKWIEEALGRNKTEKWGTRVIDIDLIYFGKEIINTTDLIVPHPHVADRRFVLLPLTEISPDFIHPTLKKKNAALLGECKDAGTVKIFRGLPPPLSAQSS